MEKIFVSLLAAVALLLSAALLFMLLLIIKALFFTIKLKIQTWKDKKEIKKRQQKWGDIFYIDTTYLNK